MQRALMLAVACLATPATAEIILDDLFQSTPPIIHDAQLVMATRRYDHAALGDVVEWGGLRLTMTNCPMCSRIPPEYHEVLALPETRVFEDVEARVADVTGDGRNDVIVVETDMARGASLAVYGPEGKIASTPFIGQTHRWLAPAGIADFDGDGQVEIAYVDRPHLAMELVIVRYADGQLIELARQAGFTNHQFGDRTIAGGARSCDGRDSVIVASADWSRALDVTLQGGAFVVMDLGAITGPDDLATFMTCS
jgi:FG-GAP-like repeat